MVVQERTKRFQKSGEFGLNTFSYSRLQSA